MPGEHAETLLIDGPRPNTRAVRFSLSPQPGADAWSIAMRREIPVAIKKGDPLLLRFWARSPESLSLGAFIETGGPEYAKSMAQTLALSPAWKQYEVRGAALDDYGVGKLTLTLHLASGRGVIELSDLRLFNPDAPAQAAGESGATPQAPASLIQNGDFASDLAASTWAGFGAPGDANARVQAQAFDIEAGAPVGARRGVRLDVNPEAGATPWSLRLGQKVQKFIGRDEAVSIKFWARSPDRARVLAVYELAEEPFTKLTRDVVRLAPEWKEFRFVGYAPRAFEAGQSQFSFFVGYDKGRIDIANVRIENFGRAPRSMFRPTIDYFGGQPQDDSWRAPALQRIEAMRKGGIAIHVVDGAGKPVPNAKISIDQQKHAFRWGTAGPLSRILDDSANSVRYREELKKHFNTFVFESDLKWPASGDASKLERVDRALAWLKANGLSAVRGHNAVWGSAQYLPAGVLDLPADELRQRVQERTRSIVGRFKGQLYVWDVVNEAAVNVALWDKIGWEEFAKVYKIAHEADPGALLAYNDYDMVNETPNGGGQRAKVYERARYLIEHGAPLDIIGDQAHMGTPLTPIGRVLEIMDETARLGKRIEITEFDVGVQDDEVHGAYTRDFVTAMFSHPDVDAFLMWGFWEGAHWRAAEGGAMLRKDWSERPAAKAWDDLLFHQWWTNVSGPSDARGNYKNRAFYGTQRISASMGGKSASADVELLKGGKAEWTLVLK